MEKKRSFEQLMTAIFELSQEFFNYGSKPKNYGVDFPLYMKEIYILSLIGDLGTTTSKELLRKTRTTKSAISHTIKKLYEKGLILKTKSSTDSREVCLQLSSLGLTVYNYNKENDRKIFDIYLKRLPELSNEEISKIAMSLDSIREIHSDLTNHNIYSSSSEEEVV